jgi:hypothetical protein
MFVKRKRRTEEENRGFRSEWIDTFAFVQKPSVKQNVSFVTKTYE